MHETITHTYTQIFSELNACPNSGSKTNVKATRARVGLKPTFGHKLRIKKGLNETYLY